MSFINERNRKKNVYEAEKAAIQEGKDGKVSALGGDNPFIRRRCLSQLGADLTKLLAEKPGEQIPDSKAKEKSAPAKPKSPEKKPEAAGIEPESPVTKDKVIQSLLSTSLPANIDSKTVR